MLISVIVPFRNAALTLRQCLEALAGQTFEDAEYIFIENHSSDNSLEIIEDFIESNVGFRGEVIREEKEGASSARNRGAMVANGEWLAFTDADCIPVPDWLKELMSAIMSEDDISAIAGCMVSAKSISLVDKFLGLYTLPSNTERRIYNSYSLIEGGFPSANLAVKKNVFEAIGGFDENIKIYGEDHDLCLRLYQAGHSLLAVTDAKVNHIHRREISGLVKQSYGFGASHALMLSKIEPGIIIIQTPFRDLKYFNSRCNIWLDFNQADKKMILPVVFGLFYPPLLLFAAMYFIYLCVSVFKRAEERNIPVFLYQSPFMVILLLMKSFAMTCGRIRGSISRRVICI